MQLIGQIISLLIAVASYGLLACSVPKDPTETALKTWWVKDLAMFSNPRVTVTDEEERPLGRFSTHALRQLSRAKIGITQASGLYSELVIVEGSEPDAFAGFLQSAVWRIPAGTPVIVVSLGLADLLSRDADAAAYLIGHETAHLLKKHVDSGETHVVLLRRIRVLTEAGANNSARPVTDSAPFTVSRIAAGYTEAQEQEAHAAGLRYATGAGYERSGALRLARMLNDATAGAVTPFFERHSPQGLGSFARP